jgi:hypothetical protein
MHTTAERLAIDITGAEEGADHHPPSGTGRWDLAHRCLATTGTAMVPGSGRRRHHHAWASRWHRRGAQQPAPGATTLAYRGSPTVGPPRPRWAKRARGCSYNSRAPPP